MIFPTLVIDSFFEDPDKIVSYSKTLTYTPDEEKRWPGVRTESLHQINYNFFNSTLTKIVSLLYPMEYKDVKFNATQFFQKVNKDAGRHKGNIHTDNTLLTAIIFLSNHKNCGTSLYKMQDLRIDYKESIMGDSIYNRLVIFDSAQIHAAQGFDDGSEGDRLTLISFIGTLNHPELKYPIPEMQRILI